MLHQIYPVIARTNKFGRVPCLLGYSSQTPVERTSIHPSSLAFLLIFFGHSYAGETGLRGDVLSPLEIPQDAGQQFGGGNPVTHHRQVSHGIPAAPSNDAVGCRQPSYKLQKLT